MSDDDAKIFDETRGLIDAYLAGELDDAAIAKLEAALLSNAEARAYFVRYCKLETDLHATLRAKAASSRALAMIGEETNATSENPSSVGGQRSRSRLRSRLLLAASVLVIASVGGTIWFLRPWRQQPIAEQTALPNTAEIAWLINAQDCQWDTAAAAGLMPGKILSLRSGLAELRMGNGATVVLEGPAQLELISRDSVRINHGKLAVRADGDAHGFQVLLPQGRVLDLGTEFGVSVANDGSAKVLVFEGKVQASPATATGGAAVTLTQSQLARVSSEGVKIEPATPAATRPLDITRQIKPAPATVARRFQVDFSKSEKGTLLDANGAPTGLTERLPGTGSQLPAHDPNLRLDTASGSLFLTTTRSDINHRFKLSEGEYLGLRLADLGFTGDEDFEISAVVPNIPSLAAVGQFGLYAGARNDLCTRGGLISQRTANRYSQFFVNNEAGIDQNAMFVGLVETGNDVRLTLRRRAGNYSLTVENLSSGSSSALSIRPLAALAGERQMYVGFFGANPGSDETQTLSITELSVTVWTRQ